MLRFLLGLLLLAVFATAQNTTTCTDPLSVATFNTLQIFFAQDKEERLDATISYFQNNQLDLDILCMQELWDTNERNEVASGLQSQYPNIFFAPRFPQDTCTGGCSGDEISRLSDCVRNADDCFEAIVTDEDFTDCVSEQCRDVLESVGPKCSTCLLSGDDFGGVLKNLDNCLDDNDNSDINDDCFAFNGESDNILFSKFGFAETVVLNFSISPITFTTALYARINTPQFGNTHVVCTHLLPADLPVFTFEESVNLNQTNQLIAYLNSVVGANETVILLGDFNHGPGFWPNNYDAMVNAGFASSYISAGNTNCTYCQSNPLSSGDTTMIIDHVYVKNAAVVNSTRIGTFYQVTVDNGDDNIPLSDHYGVRSDLCVGNTPSLVLSSSITVVDNDQIDDSEDPDNNGSTFIGVSLLLTIISMFF